MRLLRGVDPARAERVACRAVEVGALNYKSIVSILAGGTVIVHANIRGPRYFH